MKGRRLKGLQSWICWISRTKWLERKVLRSVIWKYRGCPGAPVLRSIQSMQELSTNSVLLVCWVAKVGVRRSTEYLLRAAQTQQCWCVFSETKTCNTLPIPTHPRRKEGSTESWSKQPL